VPPFRLAKLRSAPEITVAADLFREYVNGLGIDLSFQDFAAELAALPGKYAPPTGELMLAYSPRAMCSAAWRCDRSRARCAR
jgi:hypothetical protein